MSKEKNKRKMKSGNKRVRKAIKELKILHAIQIAIITSVFKSMIAVIAAAKMKKSEYVIGGVSGVCGEEVVLPMKELHDLHIKLHDNIEGILIPDKIQIIPDKIQTQKLIDAIEKFKYDQNTGL